MQNKMNALYKMGAPIFESDSRRWAASRGTQIWRYRIIPQKNATGFAKRLSRLLIVPSYRTVGRFIHANCSDGFAATLKVW